jgi:hypothetical protein
MVLLTWRLISIICDKVATGQTLDLWYSGPHLQHTNDAPDPVWGPGVRGSVESVYLWGFGYVHLCVRVCISVYYLHTQMQCVYFLSFSFPLLPPPGPLRYVLSLSLHLAFIFSFHMWGKTLHEFLFFFGGWGVIVGFELTLPLKPLCQPFSMLSIFWDRGLWTICLGLALNCNPPDLCLLSS